MFFEYNLIIFIYLYIYINSNGNVLSLDGNIGIH
jgi:hypothetical protein